jgi:hypothetical protein
MRKQVAYSGAALAFTVWVLLWAMTGAVATIGQPHYFWGHGNQHFGVLEAAY